jgi:GT2 family glycosyltransferase
MSIIIVSHNEEHYLQRTIDSFLRYLPPRAEIIVVDDHSTDGSCDFLSATGQKYHHVICVRPPLRLGVSRARNFGAAHASGDVLIFSDAHVEVSAGWAGPLLNKLTDQAVGAVAPAIGILDSTGGARGYGMTFSADNLEVEWLGSAKGDPFPVPLLCGCFLAIRTDVFRIINGFDSGMEIYGSEDLELSLHLWLRGFECCIVPEVVIAHRFTSGFKYSIEWEPLYNVLRMGAVHLGIERFSRLISTKANDHCISPAWERLVSSDVWIRRSEIQRLRHYDDEWYFDKFAPGSY